MFETAELGQKIEKDEFDARVPELRTNLLRVQRELQAASFPVLILLNGVDGAGKGDTMNLLHEWMDPRFLETYAIAPRTEEEIQRPDSWRFWMALPPRGRVGVFLGSWYTEPILTRVMAAKKKKKKHDAQLDTALIHVNQFEKELVDDGALILKFWFHLSKQQQRKRLKRLEKDPETRWRVTKDDWNHYRLYDEFRTVCERTLRETDTGEAPWVVVEGADARYRYTVVAEHITESIDSQLALARRKRKPARKASASPRRTRTVLDKLDMSRSLAKKRYESELERWQARINALSREAKAQGIGAIALFEGWDAGGKGGAIRRVTRALDARDYRIIPIAAPTDEEKAHHYLWRFWRHLPRLGTLTIYDRSWYGRVLVERVERFATEAEWTRAYYEINDFEEQLADHGIVLAKYWLHITKDEQLRRFKERETIPWKQHKITPEDYRNRRKWDAYERAANEMIGRTSTEYAPWTLVEADNKRYARIKVLKDLCKRYQAALK